MSVDQLLAALADAKRREVVDVLAAGPCSASDLADALELSRPAMSRHLRVLRRTGVVREQHPEEDARVRIYSLRPEALSALRQWLDEVERFWGGELQAFKAHAERGASRPKVKRAKGRRRG